MNFSRKVAQGLPCRPELPRCCKREHEIRHFPRLCFSRATVQAPTVHTPGKCGLERLQTTILPIHTLPPDILGTSLIEWAQFDQTSAKCGDRLSARFLKKNSFRQTGAHPWTRATG